MKLIYLIPVIGWIAIYNDIPMEEDQRSYKPLQGDTAFAVMFANAAITILSFLVILLTFE